MVPLIIRHIRSWTLLGAGLNSLHAEHTLRTPGTWTETRRLCPHQSRTAISRAFSKGQQRLPQRLTNAGRYAPPHSTDLATEKQKTAPRPCSYWPLFWSPKTHHTDQPPAPPRFRTEQRPSRWPAVHPPSWQVEGGSSQSSGPAVPEERVSGRGQPQRRPFSGRTAEVLVRSPIIITSVFKIHFY